MGLGAFSHLSPDPNLASGVTIHRFVFALKFPVPIPSNIPTPPRSSSVHCSSSLPLRKSSLSSLLSPLSSLSFLFLSLPGLTDGVPRDPLATRSLHLPPSPTLSLSPGCGDSASTPNIVRQPRCIFVITWERFLGGRRRREGERGERPTTTCGFTVGARKPLLFGI